MNTWEAIFSQSRANDGYYDGEKLLPVHWEWPKRTWFQARLNLVRENEQPWILRGIPRPKSAGAPRAN
ncbi:MAG TPA: hypothetical protein VE131_13685 [Terriglobales bacterium]|nr:hypothetical protein [Terriglobales bacterium]